MILMRTKYLENLLRDSSLSLCSIVKILFITSSLDNSKMPFEQLFLDDPLFTVFALAEKSVISKKIL